MALEVGEFNRYVEKIGPIAKISSGNATDRDLIALGL